MHTLHAYSVWTQGKLSLKYGVLGLLATRVANGSLPALLGRQQRAYLQRLRDLNQVEERARRDGRSDLARLIRGALLHTEADLKWVDELAADTHGGKTE